MQTITIYTQTGNNGFHVAENGTLIMPVQEFEMDWEIFTNELEFE